MKHSVLQSLLGGLLGICVCTAAQASSPAEKLVCTRSPRTEWMPEAKIREIFGDKDYDLVKFKISRGNCYEFYAIHKDNSIVEAYYHPISGMLMRHNRVSTQTAVPAYDSHAVRSAAGKP